MKNEINIEVNNGKLDSNSCIRKASLHIDYDEIFSSINEERIKEWENILYKNRSHSIKFVKDDSDLLNEELNLQNQRVIKNDCDRTRVKDKPLLTSYREYLESLLTYYCRINNIKYKQGMNEIFGPMILLKSKVSITLSKIYNLCTCFMEKFLTNYYYEDEFYSLQSSLALLNLLLKYHDPTIHNIFAFSLITPEMYATSWVLTIFANKTKLGILYHFWDILIKENDQMYVHYFVISFLLFHKDEIINTDYSQIPSILSQLTLRSNEEVDIIANKARDIRSVTPFSLRLLSSKLEIFKPYSKRLKELFNLYEPENMMTLPILPSEVFFIAYNNIVNCYDNNCMNFKNTYNGEEIIYEGQQNEYFKNFECFNCESKRYDANKTKKNNAQIINYILLDLRLCSEKNNEKHYDVKPGFLPMTVILDQSELNDLNLAETLSNRFLAEKEKYHFIFITSETDYFSEYEEKYYREKISEKEKRKMMYGLQTKVSKEMNENLINKILKKDKSKRLHIKIREYDNLKKLINEFVLKNYPYVSFVCGGFKEIHELSLKFNIPLLNHDENCYLCVKNMKKNLKKGFFSKLFNTEKKLKEEKTKDKYPSFNTSGTPRKVTNDLEVKNIIKRSETFKNYEVKQHSAVMKSNIRNDLSGEKLIENLNKLEVDVSNLCTIDQISNLISDPNYVVFTCLLVEYKNLYNKFEKGLQQIMLFLNNKEIKIYKLERNYNKSNTANDESLDFILIETIKISDIITIITKKQTKNIVTLQFSSDLFGKSSIIIDLITDLDSKSFISKTKQLIDAYIKEINK